MAQSGDDQNGSPKELDPGLSTSPRRVRPLSKIIRDNDFLAPAAVGLAAVIVTLWGDSPYAWVLTFAYFLIGLPGLFFFHRHRPRPDDDAWKATPVESESNRNLRAKLERGRAQKTLHYAEFERAVGLYQNMVRAMVRVRSCAIDPDEPRLKVAESILTGAMERLQKCEKLLSVLSSGDTHQAVRRVQSLIAKAQLTEREQFELKSLQIRMEEREKSLRILLEQFAAVESAVSEIKKLGQKQRST